MDAYPNSLRLKHFLTSGRLTEKKTVNYSIRGNWFIAAWWIQLLSR